MFFKKGFLHLFLSIFSLIITICNVALAVDTEGYDQPPALIWEVPNYNLRINTISKDLLIGLNLTPEVKEPNFFGLCFARDFDPETFDAGAFWVLELYDAAGDRLIKRMTLEEMFGLTEDEDCRMILNIKEKTEGREQEAEGREQRAESRGQEAGGRNKKLETLNFKPETLKTAYVVKNKDYNLTLIRTYELVEEGNLPGGKKLRATFKVINNGQNIFDLKVNQRHRADDYQEAVGKDVILALKEEGYPILIQRYTPTPVEIRLSNDEGSGFKTENLKLETLNLKLPDISEVVFGPVMLIPGKETELFSIDYSVATTKGKEEARAQAENIISYLKTKRPKSELIGQAQASDTEPLPGDVVTYTLTYINNGTGEASEAVIQTPIPLHTKYMPDSAKAFARAEIFYSIDEGRTYSVLEPEEKPQIMITDAQGKGIVATIASAYLTHRVTNVKWVAKEPIKAGEGMEVSFRVRVE